MRRRLRADLTRAFFYNSVLVYIWALLGLEGLSLGIIECLIFGSTLSATDPVTVVRHSPYLAEGWTVLMKTRH